MVALPDQTWQLDATRITITEFISEIRTRLDRPVVDKTGLTGIYQLKVLLPPPSVSPAMPAVLGDRFDAAPSGVSVSRSVAELGLTLEAKNTPMDFIIIDRIERPTPD